MQGILFYYDVFKIFTMLLHVIDILFGYLGFSQYLIILIVLILQLCFEFLFIFQSPLQILNRYILLLYDMFIFLISRSESLRKILVICTLYFVAY
jgi:hypothetical protein